MQINNKSNYLFSSVIYSKDDSFSLVHAEYVACEGVKAKHEEEFTGGISKITSHLMTAVSIKKEDGERKEGVFSITRQN